MSKRLAVVVAAAVAALGCIASASADTAPVPLSSDAASALIAGPGTSGVSDTATVDASTALAAAASPDAVTSYESDLTLDQAVGLQPVGVSTSSKSSPASASPQTKIWCWANAYWWRWGTWPYDQKITDTTYWCAKYGVKVTYRTSTVTAGGTLCGVSWRASALIGGGTGFPFFTMRSSAGFACPTVIPWVTLHPSHHLDVSRDDTGTTLLVGSG